MYAFELALKLKSCPWCVSTWCKNIFFKKMCSTVAISGFSKPTARGSTFKKPVWSCQAKWTKISRPIHYRNHIDYKSLTCSASKGFIKHWYNWGWRLWLSWLSGPFQYQRSAVRIQSAAKSYVMNIYLLSTVLKRRK